MSYGKTKEDQEKDDKRNLVSLKAGTANQQLINASYMGARAKTNPLEWVGMIEKGMESFATGKAEVEQKFKIQEEVEEAEREELLKSINTDAEKITNALGGSLDPDGKYFETAYKHVESIRVRYLEAVNLGTSEGDMEAAKIKSELNALGMNVAQIKDNITANAAIIEGKDLATLTKAQLVIVEACNAQNGSIDGDGVKWKNPDFQKEGGVMPDKEFFTMEDYNSAVVQKDYKYKEAHITKVNKNIEAGINFKNGKGSDFSYETTFQTNKSSITKDNIQYLLNDNFVSAAETGETFAAALEYNPQLIEFFEGGDEVMNNLAYPNHPPSFPDEGLFSEENLNSLQNRAKYDKNNDGVITWRDFADNELDAMKKLKTTILQPDAPNFDFEISKDLLAEWITLRDKKDFYGDSVVPDDATMLSYKGKTKKELDNLGVNMGMFKGRGISFDKNGELTIDKKIFNKTSMYSSSGGDGNKR